MGTGPVIVIVLLLAVAFGPPSSVAQTPNPCSVFTCPTVTRGPNETGPPPEPKLECNSVCQKFLTWGAILTIIAYTSVRLLSKVMDVFSDKNVIEHMKWRDKKKLLARLRREARPPTVYGQPWQTSRPAQKRRKKPPEQPLRPG